MLAERSETCRSPANQDTGVACLAATTEEKNQPDVTAGVEGEFPTPLEGWSSSTPTMTVS